MNQLLLFGIVLVAIVYMLSSGQVDARASYLDIFSCGSDMCSFGPNYDFGSTPSSGYDNSGIISDNIISKQFNSCKIVINYVDICYGGSGSVEAIGNPSTNGITVSCSSNIDSLGKAFISNSCYRKGVTMTFFNDPSKIPPKICEDNVLATCLDGSVKTYSNVCSCENGSWVCDENVEPCSGITQGVIIVDPSDPTLPVEPTCESLGYYSGIPTLDDDEILVIVQQTGFICYDVKLKDDPSPIGLPSPDVPIWEQIINDIKYIFTFQWVFK